MGLFTSDNPKEKQHSGILGAFAVDVIKWEPETDAAASVIAHKYEYEDFPNGSMLIVGPSQMAVFTNNVAAGSAAGTGADGRSQFSVFVGPCKVKLETGDSRFAPFRNITHSLTGEDSAFHSTVYFLNTTYMNELNWGTQAPLLVEDPEEGVNVHVRAFGLFGAHLEQLDEIKSQVHSRMFLQKVVGTRADFTRDELVSFMRSKILEYVPNLLSNAIISKNIGVLKISAYLSDFSREIYEKLVGPFEEFGLTLDNFSFHNINVPDEDLAVINQAKIERKADELKARGTAAKMDIESEARARMRQREGYTFQQEQAFGVMQAAAENEGTASNLMGAGMGLGMGFGMGNVMQSGMSAVAQTTMGGLQSPAPAAEASGTKKCPECGTENVADAKFCLNCGHKYAPAANQCPECGKELVPGARFCPYCGHKLEAVCPNCGKKLVPGAKFCLECGTKL